VSFLVHYPKAKVLVFNLLELCPLPCFERKGTIEVSNSKRCVLSDDFRPPFQGLDAFGTVKGRS
jgi:hypothetical protein